MLETTINCNCIKCGKEFTKIIRGRTEKELKSRVERGKRYYRFCEPCYSCEKPGPREEVTCPYWIYKEHLHNCVRKVDSYDLITRTVVLLVKPSQVEKVKDIIARASSSGRGKQEDEKRYMVAIHYADYKDNTFGKRVVKAVAGSYNPKSKTIDVIARNEDDWRYIIAYNEKKARSKS